MKKKAKNRKPDAIELLDADHVRVLALFERFRELVRTHAAAPVRRVLAEEICRELTVHDRLEKELFYPAARKLLRDDDLVDEAEEDHGSVRELIRQVLERAADDALFDAKVAVLADYFERHVRQEREAVFQPMRASRIELKALAVTITARNEKLRAEGQA